MPGIKLPVVVHVAEYRYLVIAQILILCSYMLVGELLISAGTNPVAGLKLLYILLSGVYGFLLWNIVRRSATKPWLITATAGLIAVLFGLVVMLENPFLPFAGSSARLYFLLIHLLLFTLEVIVLRLAILDLFYSHAAIEIRLWASACIYFTLAICFGGLYDTLNILFPGSFGNTVGLGFESYITGISYSLNVIGGMEPPFTVSQLMHRLGTLQSIWCNLYLVLLIGQVLGK
jgi:hypothetical protein